MGILGYDRQQLGRMSMRDFVNAVSGYREKMNETWEQARMIAWYSAFDRKPFKIADIWIPGDDDRTGRGANQENKEDLYKLLDKWNK